MYGYKGKRLRIDLSSGKIFIEHIPAEHLKKWLGGRGLNSELLYREVGPEVDPLSPDNLLIFGVGPLTGTFAPSGGRITVTAKSPMQDPYGFGDSNMGGHWGAELKYAGYDQLVIKGKASEPESLAKNSLLIG